MMKRALILLFACFTSIVASGSTPDDEVARWEARAARVTIIRDNWGIPHIYAPTDADAIFGLMYAQAEDDFPRIERNFLVSLGRLAEAEGERALWQDLRMRLFIDYDELKALYAQSPDWLKKLMDAWADGLNYYLHTHPEVKPLVLTRFEPWMALSFSEGSIGGDISKVNLRHLRTFYENPRLPNKAAAAGEGAAPSVAYADGLAFLDPELDPPGSNGIALAPRNTKNGNALLLINPHTSFYFRHEAHVVSEEGLNAYGALTWGQFFIYQGFNESAGWMHTTSTVDNIDEFVETVFERDGALFYRYGQEERPVRTRAVTIRYRTKNGTLAERTFTTYRTHHGPIVRYAEDGRWVAVAMMEEPMRALMQSYGRTKAKNLAEFVEVMRSHTNSSNNTIFADREGNIAFFHSNFNPRRDDRFDYTRPVDGSDPATDWKGLHTVEESPNVINPSTGFVVNTNNWPYSAAGAASPRQEDYPRYMDSGIENPRGINALRLLEGKTDFTLESLRDLAYSTYLPAFEKLVPALVADWEALPASDRRKAQLAEQVQTLRDWDLRWDTASVATALAIFWGTALRRQILDDAREAKLDAFEYAATRATPAQRLDALVSATNRLQQDFGTWKTPWGQINRFQRLSGDIDLKFDDNAPSIAVGFTAGMFGSLAVSSAAPRNGTKKWYGTSGNSFVAVVEFGPRVRAIALTAGGLSNDPKSPHFLDQAHLFPTGALRPVYFYRDEVEAAAERKYRPGER